MGKDMGNFTYEVLFYFITLYREFTRVIKKKLKKVLAMQIIVFALLFILYNSKQSYYKSTITFVYSSLHKKVYGDEIHKLENLCDKKDYNTLSSLLNIPPNISQSLLKINAVNIANSPLHEDITPEQLPFYVILEYSTKSNGDILKKSITSFLENMPQAIKSMSEKNEETKVRKQFLMKQMQYLDSLKISLTQSQTTAILIGGSNTNIKDIFELSSNYQAEITQLDNKLLKTKAVEIFSDDVPHYYDKSEWLMKKAPIYYILLSFLGIVILFIENRFKNNNYVFSF